MKSRDFEDIHANTILHFVKVRGSWMNELRAEQKVNNSQSAQVIAVPNLLYSSLFYSILVINKIQNGGV